MFPSLTYKITTLFYVLPYDDITPTGVEHMSILVNINTVGKV